MKLAPVKKRVGGLFAQIFKPRPAGTIADWASGRLSKKPNIFLSSKESGDFSGPYDPDLNPLPTVLFDVFQGKIVDENGNPYTKAVFKKSSQSGVTLAVLILICYFVVVYSRNFLYVIDTLEEMRRLSQERLTPMLKGCRAASGQIPEEEGEMKTLTLSLRSCVGYLAGAHSLGALSNKSVGLAVYDEVDAHPAVGEGDEHAVDLGGERGKKQTGFFEVLLSKPIEWDGRINQEYLHGSRHHCHVPCPHCGTYQELVFERLRFEQCRDEKGDWDFDRVDKETFYLCVSKECQESPAAGRIEETHKPGMIAARRWVQTNFGQDEHKPEPGVFSCELTDMYSTFPTARWSTLAAEWIKSEGKPSKRKRFERGRLARARQKRKIETREMDIYAMRRPDYLRGECPVEPDVVLLFGDTQEVVKKWVKCAFTLDDDACYVIDWGDCLSYGDIMTAADVPVRVKNWRPETPVERRVDPVVYKGLVDEGFRQKEVRSWVVSTILPHRLPDGSPDFRFFSSWGQGGMHSRSLKDLVVPRVGDAPNATHNGFPIYAYRFSDDNFKSELYIDRIGEARKVKEAEAEGREPEKRPAPLHFPWDITRDFASELCQERYEWSAKLGRFHWPECRHPNDYGDGVKGCLVGWYIVRPAILLNRLAMENARRAAAN